MWYSWDKQLFDTCNLASSVHHISHTRDACRWPLSHDVRLYSPPYSFSVCSFFSTYMLLDFFSYAAFDRSLIACLCFNTPADAVQTPHAARRLNTWANKYQTKEDII